MIDRNPPELPQTLAARIRDLRPAHAVLRSEVRALAVMVLSIVAAAVLLSATGVRHDISVSTIPFVAMLSAGICLGLGLVLLALKEAVPAGNSLTTAIYVAIASGSVAVVALPLLFGAIARYRL